MRRKVALGLLAAATGILGAIGGASAKSACVSYSVTTQQTGTKSGTRCAPLPDWFTGHITVSDCQGIPPIGFSDCVVVSTDLP